MNDGKAKHPILLVDDEPEILQSLKGLLRREFELYTAESGKEALAILEQHEIHVVVTDERMPQMTGVQLMGQVAERYPEAIRIVFTGYADINAVIDAINKGGLYRYITKPWDPDEFIQLLHEAARQYEVIAGRRQLLSDLAEHVREGQRLIESVRAIAASDRAVQEELDQYAQATNQLIHRLDQFVPA